MSQQFGSMYAITNCILSVTSVSKPNISFRIQFDILLQRTTRDSGDHLGHITSVPTLSIYYECCIVVN